MKSAKILIQFTAIFGILLLPVLVFAQSPSLPHQFFGSVNYTNGAAPNGLVVEARISGSVVGSSITAGGNYGYNPNLLFALDNDGVHAGKTVEFYVSGIKANETAVFVNGNSSQVNLTIPASLPTTPTSTSGDDGGGGGGGATTTTTPQVAGVSTIKGDANNDQKVDILDFNILMINWGKTGSGIACDFNSDGKIDIFDFNLLMINWTK